MKYVLVLVLWGYWGSLYAQELSSKPLKTNKQWEIGGNFAGAIVTGSIINNTLFAQKNFTKTVGSKSKNIAHRYGIGLSNFWEDNSGIGYPRHFDIDMRVYVGKQWSHQQNKFQWYYGDDIECDIQSHIFPDSSSNISSSRFMLASNSFVGVKYFISNRFSVGWEGALQIRWQQNRSGWIRLPQNPNSFDAEYNSLGMMTLPIYAIRLLYKL